MTVYHVAKNGRDANSGSNEAPFLTINQAAQVARAGDEVVVHEGIYREWVQPKYSGSSDQNRIIYRAAQHEKVVIKGSEQIRDWQPVAHDVWKTVIPNQLFGQYNPFATRLTGDWLEQDNNCHAGDVFINGVSGYEAHCYEDLTRGPRTKVQEYVTKIELSDPHAEQTVLRWYAEVDSETTALYVHCPSIDLTQADVEVSVRKCCFYPTQVGCNYLTVMGFEICQAACPWAPPTAEQFGMLGTHWSKGWQIINNDLHDAKCCAISIGCPALADDNAYSQRHDKPGYQYQLERVFSAQRAGWSKDTVGHHMIRHNRIHHCGQCGIVGNLGGIFSQITDNHIYEIGTKFEFSGWEVAAIKLHAPIDAQLMNNRIDHCVLGTWLDWQAQGTRISQSLFHHNIRDLLIEMCHGPLLVDHNWFLSKRAIDNYAQGTAFVNNLIAGQNTIQSVLNRATPYHLPHSTLIKGYAMNYGGDDRYYNNIFIRPKDSELVSGTACYDGSPVSMTNYVKQVEARLPGDVELFETVRQPVYIDNNVYLHGATMFAKEAHGIEDVNGNPHIKLNQDQDGLKLTVNLPDRIKDIVTSINSSSQLAKVRLTDAKFEDPAGLPIDLSIDYFGQRQTGVGPGGLHAGVNQLKL